MRYCLYFDITKFQKKFNSNFLNYFRIILGLQKSWKNSTEFLHSPHSYSAGKEPACNDRDLGSIPGLGRSPGESKGYPFQYSVLENSMDCTVHGVAKSWTWLSNFHFTSFYILLLTAHIAVTHFSQLRNSTVIPLLTKLHNSFLFQILFSYQAVYVLGSK